MVYQFWTEGKATTLHLGRKLLWTLEVRGPLLFSYVRLVLNFLFSIFPDMLRSLLAVTDAWKAQDVE